MKPATGNKYEITNKSKVKNYTSEALKQCENGNCFGLYSKKNKNSGKTFIIYEYISN